MITPEEMNPIADATEAAPITDAVDGVLDARGLGKRHVVRPAWLWQPAVHVTALVDVSLSLRHGQSIGMVGARGAGKTTLARLVAGLDRPDTGTIRICGHDPHRLSGHVLRQARSDVQLICTRPGSALDPRWTVAQIVTEPLQRKDVPNQVERRERAWEALGEVGLRNSDLDRHPPDFTRGELQRIALARAFITRPKLIVADDPVGVLDMTVRAQLINLMMDLRNRHGTAYLFMGTDLAMVARLCDEVCVLEAGRVVERGLVDVLRTSATHAATHTLLNAAAFG